MKKRFGLLVGLITLFLFLISCTPISEVEETQSSEKLPFQEEKAQAQQPDQNVAGLGSLCSTEEECKEFCSSNRGRCESYCRDRTLELCTVIFQPDSNSPSSQTPGPQTNNGCTGSGTVQFTSPPMRVEEIEIIEPIGLMIGGHVTPIDHGYYYAKGWRSPGNREDATQFRDVMAPAAGVVTSVQSMPQEYSSSSIGDYRLVIHHTCSFYTIYIHINQLSEKLQTIVDTSKTVQVQAGEIIGRAPGFDFSVHNDEITLPGFIVPETYIAEPWKLHNVDMFDYFTEPIRTQLLDRNVRQKEPRGGKIDYDIDGKLVGNWFEENTNGYFGKTEYQRLTGYWSTHLAFAYDGLDPSLIIVSLGDYNGEATQFAVKNNIPDPQDVDSSDGLIKYELVSFSYTTESGERWDGKSFTKMIKADGNDEQVTGVVLVQMLENRKIKFESFPGKTASQVNEFTVKAKIYER
ncbi:hypothetical protein J4444_05095 [Candidatus Woesearchaeota archaeon]|nr:hypothetical protein [Candidatus Woesearchaeota archaeon]